MARNCPDCGKGRQAVTQGVPYPQLSHRLCGEGLGLQEQFLTSPFAQIKEMAN